MKSIAILLISATLTFGQVLNPTNVGPGNLNISATVTAVHLVGEGSGITGLNGFSGIATNGGSGLNNSFTNAALTNPTFPNGLPLTGIITNGGSGINNRFTNTDLTTPTFRNQVIASGVATLANGLVDVITPAANITNIILLTYLTDDGTRSILTYGSGSHFVSDTKFRITSGNPSDGNRVSWAIIKP